MDARTSRYSDVYARWQRDPEGFWAEAAQAIDWIETPKRIFDPDAGVYGRWFVDGVCNTCWNAVDRHVMSGRGEQVAIIYDSPLAGQKRTLTYHRLQVETQVLAAILRNFGVEKGDRVILYMPMVPEAVIAMLACARIGAVHSVVFGGFAANELATRIDDAKPKLVLSASCGLEPGRIVAYKPLLDEAIRLATHKPGVCLILQRPQRQAALLPGRDHDWAQLRDEAIVFARWSMSARRLRRPIRCTFSTPPEPPAGPKAWYATMAVTWLRSNGRCKTYTALLRARRGGAGPTSAG